MRVLYSRRLPGIVLPFALTAKSRVRFRWLNDPGKDRPAIALVPNAPARAISGSFQAPLTKFCLFGGFVKRPPGGEMHC